jgi:Carboxypeptidase regulatory-like domain
MKLAIITVLISLTSSCFSQTIRGIVFDTDTKKPLSDAFVYLVKPDNTKDTSDIYYWSHYKYKIISQTKTDSSGKYSFTSLTPKVYNIVADFPMPKSEELGGYGVRQEIDSNINIKAKTNYFKIFYLMVTCPFDKTKNQSFCPKCKKTDLVKPILFGLPAYKEDEHYYDKYYLGGCYMDVYCNPTKHCSRCKKDF